ncbi:hypothetical protein K435DRAFT_974877 [Dendrothele bispora CBS 962.96]|uniref:Uncharacterized protein n=1 Tax=Dendrothele bispora (strain CBS 962.96) TaxID=1314807 RepID=A0A4S8KIS9_DENBC|nr:hypothetical protein K435DRAFT_974877 [Dendrothele bispora CBS 962.96]
MRYSVTSLEIDEAARATIAGLKRMSLNCCLVGSVACSAYGMSRTPADIDMVVLTSSYTQEELKNRLVSYDPRFYTVASKDPLATYRVLWFRLSGYRRCCKVDLLLPGVMNIPLVPLERIYRMKDHQSTVTSESSLSSYYSTLSTRSADYPLMPFLPLLLLKLQAWQDHGESPKLYMREKQPTDVKDINELLDLAVTKYAIVTVRVSAKGSTSKGQTLLEKEKIWLPATFIRDGKTRVRKYVEMYPASRRQWKVIGFDVDDGVSSAEKYSREQVRLGKGDDNLRRLESLMASLAVDDY